MLGKVRSPHRSRRESGQAVVESALTLPLVIFTILGTVQLGMMLTGRMMAHYAAFRATRAGSVNFGDCDRMSHAALAALLPSIIAYMGPNTPGATPSDKFANAFADRMGGPVVPNSPSSVVVNYNPAKDSGYSEQIFWILRDRPTIAQVAAAANNGQDTEFDQWDSGPPMRLEIRLIYWFPMKIPFANWVMYQMFRAHFGLGAYNAVNPLMVTQKNANWPGGDATVPLTAGLAAEFTARGAAKHYAFPIQTTYTMRMMTPAKVSKFTTQHCPGAPNIAVP